MAFGIFGRKKETGIERTPAQVAKFLEDFLNSTGPKWEWDDFLSTPLADAELEKIRKRCQKLDLEFPPAKPGDWCNEQGLAVVRSYVEQLRASTAASFH
jgi:hypothetical protein